MDFALGGGGSLADDDGSGANEQSEEVWCSLRQYLQRGSGLALPVNVSLYSEKSICDHCKVFLAAACRR